MDLHAIGMNLLNSVVTNLGSTLIGAASLWITYHIIPWFKSQKALNDQAHAQKEEKHQLDIGYAAKDALLTDVPDVVLEVKQTYLDGIQGAKTDDQKAIAKRKAIDKLEDLLTEEAKKALGLVIGDIPKYLETLIESNVQQLKLKTELPKLVAFDPAKQ